MCNTIGIIEQGRLLYSGPIDEARKKLGGERVIRVCVQEEGEDERSVNAVLDLFRGHPDVEAMKPGGVGELFVRVRSECEDVSFLAREIVRAEMRLLHLEETALSVEDIFLQVTKGKVA